MLDTKIITLLKVVETGNYTKAAKLLGLTQPAISQHIKGIEDEYGTKVFERVGNTFILTRDGEIIVEYARSMVALTQKLKDELADEKTGQLTLRIGITHTVESNRISEIFAKYANTNPGVSIRLVTDTLPKLKEMLKNYELDFAIVDGKITSHSLKSMQLDTDSLMFIVSPDHPLVGNAFVTANDIKKEKLILRHPNSGTSNLFISSLESQNLSIDDYNVILEMDNVATIKNLIKHNYGVSVLPRSTCRQDIKDKTLYALPIENLTMIRDINIVYNDHFKHPDILQTIMDMYNEE